MKNIIKKCVIVLEISQSIIAGNAQIYSVLVGCVVSEEAGRFLRVA